MTKWSVRLVIATSAAPTDDQIETLHAGLTVFSAALGCGRAEIDAQLTVPADNLPNAIAEAARAVRRAATDAGFEPGDIVEAEAMTWDKFVQRMDSPQVPELWSVTEAAEFLGVSNQRINQLLHAYPGALPPVMKLSGDRGARLWLADTWRRFAKSGRHSAGRRMPAEIGKGALT